MDEMKTLTINDVTYEIVDETARAQVSNKQDRLDVPSWVASALPSNTAWHTVAYGNGTYVAITNDSNKTAYSTDGINWTETTNLPSESDWRSIVYGDGKFVAIAYGTAGAYSTDGINWTPITFPVSRNRSSVTYGNGTFVAICASSDAVSYSTDGINWSESTLPSAGSWQSVTYGNGVFVAVVNSSDAAAYSTDGITWTATTLPSNTRWRSVAYGNGMFVAVATNVNTAAYSTDGITWAETTLPTTASWYSVVYGNGMFMAVAYNSAVSMYSIDGINWTETELPYKTYWYSVAYGPIGFVAIGFSSDKAAYAKTTELFAARIDSDAIPVTSVNGKTGAIQLNADDVGAVATGDFGSLLKTELQHAPGISIYDNGNYEALFVAKPDFSTSSYIASDSISVSAFNNIDGNLINRYVSISPDQAEFRNDEINCTAIMCSDEISLEDTEDKSNAFMDSRCIEFTHEQEIAYFGTDMISFENDVHAAVFNRDGIVFTAPDAAIAFRDEYDTSTILEISTGGGIALSGVESGMNVQLTGGGLTVRNDSTTLEVKAGVITGLAAPTEDDQAANKAYVDSKAGPTYSYGTEDLTAGTSPLESGKLYFVYE